MQNRDRRYKTRTRIARLYRRYRLKLDETKITPEAHEAIVECLRIAGRRGRELRLARERGEKDKPTAVPNPPTVATLNQANQPLAENDPPQEAGPPELAA